MAQHDYNIANAPGASVRADINALAEAIASLNSGAAAPTTTFANMFWYDTTNSLLKVRSPDNTSWITLASVSGTTFAFVSGVLANALGTGSVGTTQLADTAVTTAKITDANVTNAKLANMATQTLKGRTSGGTGVPEDLSATQATAILNAMVGDSGAGGTKGLVPAPAAGDAASGKYLTAGGLWAVPGGPLLSGTKAAVASFDIDLTSLYSLYRGFHVILTEGLVSTDSSHIGLRTSADGTTFDATSGNYTGNNHYTDTGGRHDKFTGDGTTSGYAVLYPFVGNAAGEGFEGTTECWGLANTTLHKRFLTRATLTFDVDSQGEVMSVFTRVSTAVIKALRVLVSAGTFSCKYAVYGIV